MKSNTTKSAHSVGRRFGGALKAFLIGAANALTGAKWNVTLNGAAVPRGYAGTASVRDGTVYASVARGGTILIIR